MRKLKICSLILLIPILGIIVGHFVSRGYEKLYENAAVQAIVEQSMRETGNTDLLSHQQFLNKIRLGVVCKKSILDSTLSKVCTRYSRMNLLTHASTITLIFAILAFAFISGLGAFSQKNRNLLFYLFRPGLFISQIGAAILVAANAGILVSSLYFAEAFYLERVHMILLAILVLTSVIAVISVFIRSVMPIKEVEIRVLGKNLSREDYPTIWKFIEALAAKVGTPAPEAILAGLEPTFFVTESTVLCLDGTARGRILFISLPFCRAISKNEFSAIIAHEMGHFIGEDTKWSKKFYPIYRGSLETIYSLHQSSGNNGLAQLAFLPAQIFMSLFFSGFEKSEKAISRERELNADSVGAKITSKKEMASALVKAHVYQRIWEITLDQMREALSSGRKIINLSKFFSDLCETVPYADVQNEISDSHTSHPTDTHPALSVRLNAMEVELSEMCTDQLKTNAADQAITLIDQAEVLENELSEIEHYRMVQTGQVQVPDQPEEQVQEQAKENHTETTA